MDIKEFATDFMENVNSMVEYNGANFDEELTEDLLEYVMDTGEISAPEICLFRHRDKAISAYDFNEEANSLDLFLLVKTDTLLGKINNDKIDEAFNKMTRTYLSSIDGTIFNKVADVPASINEVAELIKSTSGKISSLRLFVLTNGLTEYNTSTVELSDGLIMEQNIWDMQRLYQQERIRAGKEKIEIDFPTTYNTQLQCVKMTKNNPDIDAYLAIIPGITLAQIYLKYQQGLLEKNVRTFLQFRSKVNKGIRETLLKEPEMFFSYNNGISTTASEITLKEEDNSLYITNLYDWQIVNGGQTTASIAAIYADKKNDLSQVFVPVKISVIGNEEKSAVIVPKISSCANSQTAVKQSDFSANDPYLVDLEGFSRATWVPNGTQKSTLKWYFERTRGQYLDDLSHQRGLNEKLFRQNYPKSHKITKTDIAKYEMAWNQRPESVCKGAEVNYIYFVKEVKNNNPSVTMVYYKRLIAKAILFKTIDKAVRASNLGGYKSNMNAYILAGISFWSKKMLDLDYIWEHQKVQDEVEKIIKEMIPIVWNHITNPVTAIKNINEWTKRTDCWTNLKLSLDSITEMSDNTKMAPEAMIDNAINPAQKAKIEEAWNIDANTWFALAKWAKENDELTPLDRKMAFSFGTLRSRGKMFTLKQAIAGLKIIETAKELGFEI